MTAVLAVQSVWCGLGVIVALLQTSTDQHRHLALGTSDSFSVETLNGSVNRRNVDIPAL